ncbi:MAG: transporter [Herminiimonas sp.]|nr:transporter [Herminiimonas sp.]
MKSLIKAVFAASLMLSSVAGAHAQSPQAGATAAVPESMSTGEVKKVNKDAGKLTIKHGPLENLGMGAMTMAFRVQDPVTLEEVTVGDKIRFVAEAPNGKLTVTKLKKQQ